MEENLKIKINKLPVQNNQTDSWFTFKTAILSIDKLKKYSAKEFL